MGEKVMEEIWKYIKGWEGLYQVSNKGRVRALPIETKFGKRKKYPLRYLTSHVSKRGYLIIGLSKRHTAGGFVWKHIGGHYKK